MSFVIDMFKYPSNYNSYIIIAIIHNNVIYKVPVCPGTSVALEYSTNCADKLGVGLG